MPDHPTWFDRVPNIIGTLKTETGPPFLDRTSIETLFGVRRRQAIVLLHRFKGYQVGRTFLVNRESVIEYLERHLSEGALQTEEVRKQRVAEFLGEARLALTLPRITLPPASTRSAITIAGLPPGIRLTPGRLSVDYDTATDLLEKLFALAQALANDFGTLEAALAAASQPTGEPDGTTT